MAWTSEQVAALAPDAASASAGRGLASPQKWGVLGNDPAGRALWGECQGSGSKPYQVQVDLAGPAFNCTCPSRKFPCKHGIALLLLFAEQQPKFTSGEPPDRVLEWLGKRDTKAQSKAEPPAPKTEEDEKKSAEAQAKRAADRESRVSAGIEEMDLWLKDVVRQGLAAVQTRPSSFWYEKAARLVDAQAPGAARLVRELAGVAASGEGWAERLIVELGKLHLLAESYRRIGDLPEAMKATIRMHIGWTLRQEELLEQPGVRERWLVVGRSTSEEEKITVQRTWVAGADGSIQAMLLSFAAGGQALDTSLTPGGAFEAELVYYPGSLPLRAAVKERQSEYQPLNPFNLPGERLASRWLEQYASALAMDPWLERFPVSLCDVVPVPLSEKEGWALCDGESTAIPISPAFRRGWQLMALSGGSAISVFGEWDGRYLLPLSAVVDGRFVSLALVRGEAE